MNLLEIIGIIFIILLIVNIIVAFFAIKSAVDVKGVLNSHQFD
jgi:hypothetical protein